MKDEAIPPQIGKYTIERPLGQGGMGRVYLARDTDLHREVAIKCLRPELADAHWQQRLKQEARVLARLNHPNIVQVHDVVECDGSVGIVTEYVNGRNLHILLRERVVGYVERVKWLSEVAAGLAAAHREMVSHNDLKAENILVGPGNVAKINDFGIASTDADLSGDIHALGTLAREITAECTERSPLLDHLVQRMTEKRASKRPDAEECAREFTHIWLESTQAETPLHDPSSARPAAARRRRILAAVFSTLLAAIAATAAYFYSNNARPAVPVYVAVLPTRLQVDDHQDSRKYALLSSSVQQGLYQAVSRAPGYSLISPSETSQQQGSPREIGKALNADELIVPAIKCANEHCELSTERLVAPDFRMQRQRSTSILPELTLEAFEITGRQWNLLYDSPGTNLGGDNRIDEASYRKFLELYESAHSATRPMREILTDLESLLSSNIQFLPADFLFVHVALELYWETRDNSFIDQASDVLRDAGRWARDDILLHKSWFEVEVLRGDFDAAAREIDTLANLGADDALLLSLNGRLYSYKADYLKSSEYYQKALRLHPSRDSYLGAAHSFYYAGDEKTAFKLAADGIAQFPDDGTLTNLQGLIYIDRGELQKATERFTAAIQIQPRTFFYVNLGLAYMLEGNYTGARDEFSLAIERGGSTSTRTLNLADALTLLGEEDRARELYQSIVDEYESGTGSVAVNQASQAFAHLGRGEKAISLLDSIKRQNSEGYFNYALVYAITGQDLAATVKVREALKANMGAVWFRLPWFDQLCREPAFVKLMNDAGETARCPNIAEQSAN